MALELPYGIRVASTDPVDYNRYHQPDLAGRDALVPLRAEVSQQVYVDETETLYILKGITGGVGTWEAVGGGGGLNVDTLDGTVGFFFLDYSMNGKTILVSYSGSSVIPVVDVIPEGAMEVVFRFANGEGIQIAVNPGATIPELSTGQLYGNLSMTSAKNMVHMFTGDGINWYITGDLNIMS